MWVLMMARNKGGHQNILYKPPNFHFIDSVFVAYDIFERFRLWPYKMQTFKLLKPATHQNARPASYTCNSLRISQQKIFTTAMLLGHITLNEFIAIFTEGFGAEPCNWQSAFPTNFKERLACRSEKICPTFWTRILGLTRWTNTARI